MIYHREVKFQLNLENKKDIACVILGAGAGRRFGMPKWKAEYEGKTFLEIIKEKVLSAGISDIACVIRKDSIPTLKDIKYVVNPNPEQGMFSSLFYGINVFPEKQGYVIIPVDHPLFLTKTLIDLNAVFQTQKDDNVVRPVFKTRAGHPIIIPASLGKRIPKGDYDGGLKRFIEDTNIPINNINVDDQDILRNINRVSDILCKMQRI